MLDRRTLLGAAAASPLLWNAAFRPAFADTPKDVVIMAMADRRHDQPATRRRASSSAATKSPATSTKNSSSPTPRTPPRSTPNSPTRWETSEDGLTTTFHLAPGRNSPPATRSPQRTSSSPSPAPSSSNKAPAFIINQFGFTKDNVAERITAPDPATVVIKHRRAPIPHLPALLPLRQRRRHRRQEHRPEPRQRRTTSATTGSRPTAPAPAPGASASWRASEASPSTPTPTTPSPPHQAPAHPAPPRLRRPAPALQKGDIDIARNLLPDQIKSLAGQSRLPPGPGHQGQHRLPRHEPEEPQPRQTGGPPSHQMGHRLQGHRRQHHPQHLRRAPGLPAPGPPRRADRKTVRQGPGQGPRPPAAGRPPRRLRDHPRLPEHRPLRRRRPGHPGQPRRNRHQSPAASPPSSNRSSPRPAPASTSSPCCAGAPTTWTRTATPKPSA